MELRRFIHETILKYYYNLIMLFQIAMYIELTSTEIPIKVNILFSDKIHLHFIPREMKAHIEQHEKIL